MTFEWDADKNRANIRKHGLDFSDAWRVFAGPMSLNADVREDYGEDRWVGIGRLGDVTVVIAFAERGHHTYRIISMRKARRHERLAHEEEIAHRLGSTPRDEG